MAKSAKSSGPAASAEVAAAVPNYEVKLFLNPARVLDVEFKPNREADQSLDLKNASTKIAMQFLDSRPPQLDPEGWNVRLRKFENKAEYELSFKRRYRIEPGRLADTLAAAAQDGFHAGEGDYAAQVEWGYEKQRLSFTRKKVFKAAGAGEIALPSLADSRAVAVRELPGKLDRQRQQGWARGLLTDGHLYGPVLGRRWEGKWQGPELDFEVWLVRTAAGSGFEPVVELSFKAAKQADAAGLRDKLTDFVRDLGWLLDHDVLKTAMILARY